jgi:zinc protease
VHRVFRAGAGPKARTSITLWGPYEAVEGSAEALAVAREVAELALSEQLRETLGATYGVSVAATSDLVPPLTYRVTIGFESDPELIDSLAAVALRELERLRTIGPTDAEAAKVRAARTRDLDNSFDDNAYWANELAWHARPGLVLAAIKSHQENARALTAASIRAACVAYLDPARHARVTMHPLRMRRHLRPEVPSAGEGGAGSGR